MAVIIRGSKDKYVKNLKLLLDQYEDENPTAIATLFRRGTACIWIRVVDSRFKRVPTGDRHEKVCNFLTDRIDDDTLDEVSLLLVLTHEEQNTSIMNFEFNAPKHSESKPRRYDAQLEI